MSAKIIDARRKTQDASLGGKSCAFLILLIASCVLRPASYVQAEELTILYTGQTHAMLYQCNCPIERDGGLARRATLIKQLRKSSPGVILVDSGSYFAGGLLDQYTQNVQLDMQRTNLQLKGMEVMGYDAVAVGDDEFNFGKEYLLDNAAKTKIPFLSYNIQAKPFLPYVLKEVSGLKIGIIGLTPLSAAPKSGGLPIIDPKSAAAKTVAELRGKKVDLIILLSHQSDAEDAKLLDQVKGIDLLIAGIAHPQGEIVSKIGQTIIVWPSWQGRKLGVLKLNIQDRKIISHQAEQLRLSADIADDREIVEFLPRCFSDDNCKQEGLVGTCQDPATLKASCVFSEPVKVGLTVITPKACKVCSPQQFVDFLKKPFPGLTVSTLYYPDPGAQEMIAKLGLSRLPAYVFDKDIERQKNFEMLQDRVDLVGDVYLVKPQVSGVSFFLKRGRKAGALDIFVSLFDAGANKTLEVVRSFSPEVHFLAVEKDAGFDAAKGSVEVEEYLKGVCIEKYYPETFWDYLVCRSGNLSSSWWDDCLKGAADTLKIKSCAQGEEGKKLLRENIRLNKELEIMFGPSYLVDNQEIFSTKGAPAKQELEKILKK